ncbi:MAG: redoxin domain-containing protein [Phycisphaerales bacterium]|jgi:hypothetical protein|nr:redoxin domain-containing protein [Phycisphaerales bacterium]
MNRSAPTRLSFIPCCLLLLALVGCVHSTGSDTTDRAPLPLKTTHGKALDSALEGDGSDIVTLIFTSTDCPVANAMAPQLSRDLRRFEELGIRCYLVYPRRGVTFEEATRHRDDYGLEATVLLDPDHVLVEALDATITPEAFVIDFQGSGEPRVRYRGRINDLYPSIGSRRDLATRHEWRDAVQAVKEGADFDPEGPGAVGCMIQRQ